jgi:hypothetical protein
LLSTAFLAVSDIFAITIAPSLAAIINVDHTSEMSKYQVSIGIDNSTFALQCNNLITLSQVNS